MNFLSTEIFHDLLMNFCRISTFMNIASLAARPLAKNGGSGNTAILKLFCRNAINKLRGWWETL